jgi:hypothetical protein
MGNRNAETGQSQRPKRGRRPQASTKAADRPERASGDTGASDDGANEAIARKRARDRKAQMAMREKRQAHVRSLETRLAVLGIKP